MNAKPGDAFRAHAMHGGPCCLVIASKGGISVCGARGGKGTSVEKRERERAPLSRRPTLITRNCASLPYPSPLSFPSPPFSLLRRAEEEVGGTNAVRRPLILSAAPLPDIHARPYVQCVT